MGAAAKKRKRASEDFLGSPVFYFSLLLVCLVFARLGRSQAGFENLAGGDKNFWGGFFWNRVSADPVLNVSPAVFGARKIKGFKAGSAWCLQHPAEPLKCLKV